jgi:hypothetical protein
MTQVARRRFPYAPGVLGWIGGALMIAGGLSQIAAVVLLMWMIFSGNGGIVVLIVGAFALGMAFIIGTIFLWKLAWKRSGSPQPDVLTLDQQAQLIREGALVAALNLLAIAAFAYLFLQLPGSMAHRFALAAVPFFLVTAVNAIYTNRFSKRLNRPPKRFLGLPSRFSLRGEIALGLVSAVLVLCAGLFLFPR